MDSSGRFDYFADGPDASFFVSAIETTRELPVPTPSLYEAFERVLEQRGENWALQAVP